MDELDLLDWKRRVFALYAEVRATANAEDAWRRWRAARDHPEQPARRLLFLGPRIRRAGGAFVNPAS